MLGRLACTKSATYSAAPVSIFSKACLRMCRGMPRPLEVSHRIPIRCTTCVRGDFEFQHVSHLHATCEKNRRTPLFPVYSRLKKVCRTCSNAASTPALTDASPRAGRWTLSGVSAQISRVLISRKERKLPCQHKVSLRYPGCSSAEHVTSHCVKIGSGLPAGFSHRAESIHKLSPTTLINFRSYHHPTLQFSIITPI